MGSDATFTQHSTNNVTLKHDMLKWLADMSIPFNETLTKLEMYKTICDHKFCKRY